MHTHRKFCHTIHAALPEHQISEKLQAKNNIYSQRLEERYNWTQLSSVNIVSCLLEQSLKTSALCLLHSDLIYLN